MTTFGRLVLLALAYSAVASSNPRKVKYQKSLVNYTVSLINHLASNQVGTFDCWLYHACSDPPGSSQLLQDTVVQLDLQLIPRRTIDSRFNWTEDASAWKRPSLVLIHVEFTSYNPPDVFENIGNLFGTLDKQVKILVLLSSRSRYVFVDNFAELIKIGKHFNVAFLSVDEEMLIFLDVKSGRFVKIRKFRAPEAMFPDQSRYLHGEPLWYSAFNGLLNACIGYNCDGYDVTIFNEFARYLNTTARYVRFVCPYEIDRKQESPSKCVYSTTMEPDCPFDIFTDAAAGNSYLVHYLETPIPNNKVLLAPRGRPLNIAELFLRPFQTELWILFFIGLGFVKLISLLIPNSFRNDPLLLPICGFERYNLNQTNKREKLLMLTLILIFFFVSNAYESKIISLMSNKPHVASVNTIQDIHDSGTPVKAGYMAKFQFPMFETLYNYHEESPNQLDGTSVYLTDSLVGYHMVQRKINWDYASNQPRYKVMHEILAMSVGFYPMPVRSALKPHFRFVQKSLFEAGILIRWNREWFARGDLRYTEPTLPGGINPSSDILKYSDLMPAWCVVWFGAVLSTVVFIAEAFGMRAKRLLLKLVQKTKNIVCKS